MPKTSDLQKTRQDFKTFYDTQLREEYAKLEISRKKYLKMFWINLTILILLLIFTVFIYKKHILDLIESDLPVYLWYSLLAFMVPLCIAPFVLYGSETKSATMEKILSFWGNFKYFDVRTISEENIKKSNIFIFGDYDIITTGDAFEGEYNNTKIYINEKQIRTSKNGFYLFDGLLIMFQFNKKLSSNTIARNHKNLIPAFKRFLILFYILACFGTLFILLILTIITDKNQCITAGIVALIDLYFGYCICKLYFTSYSGSQQKKLQSVALEDASFNKEWTVTTDNQIDARRFLTPVFMEKISDIERLFHGKAIDFSLFENKLIIAVHTHKDLFETSALFTPVLSYKKVSEVFEQLYSIFAVVDIIKNNTNFMTVKKLTEKRKNMIKNIYVFRHGETDLNREGRFQGQSNNTPLNSTGLTQAAALADKMKDIPIDIVFTSPLQRAYQTGATVARQKNVPIIADNRLIEGNFGVAEGMLNDDIKKQMAKEYKRWRDFKDMDFAFEGGESKQQILERVLDFVEFLQTRPEQNIAVSTHSAVIRSLLINLGVYRDRIPNAEFFHLLLQDGKLRFGKQK